MKLGVLQPYLFPYIGYFQLIRTVDAIVIYDDAQWMKGGWINRNRYLVEGAPRFFTLPVAQGAVTDPINWRVFAPNIDHHKQRILRQLGYSYGKAPYFEAVHALVKKCFDYDEANVAKFLLNSLRECCDFLGIQTPFVLSSGLAIQEGLKAEDRVLEINRVMGSNHYINPIGGIGLYDRARFNTAGIRLSFLRSRQVSYPQPVGEFIPSLSILDAMMFNSRVELSGLLEEFDLQ